MYKTVFISHSKHDPNVDFFHRVFSGLKTDAIWMEYENIDPPPWKTIRENVNKSDAVFVLLSSPLLYQIHTNNWVSFEVGLAANCRKILSPLGLDVYVFEPRYQLVDFPVPYCTHYMLYEQTTEELKYLKKMIKESPSIYYGEPISCPHQEDCGITFGLLTFRLPPEDIEHFFCPACRKEIFLNPPTDVEPS